MRLEDYEALLNSVAETVSAPGYFPLVMPENDLHPDPRALRDELVSVRHRLDRLEKIIGLHGLNLGDATHGCANIREFPRR